MQIQEVIKTVNQMEADRVIERYAIGGAVGATFYLEPVATLDVDIFIAFQPEPGKRIVSLDPLFNHLKTRGCKMEGEYVLISGWPVQFLPATTPLVAEALDQAVEKNVDGIRTRVFTAEHLAAIALQTARAKDKSRLLQFIEADTLNETKFQDILDRNALGPAWKRFQQQFLDAP